MKQTQYPDREAFQLKTMNKIFKVLFRFILHVKQTQYQDREAFQLKTMNKIFKVLFNRFSVRQKTTAGPVIYCSCTSM